MNHHCLFDRYIKFHISIKLYENTKLSLRACAMFCWCPVAAHMACEFGVVTVVLLIEARLAPSIRFRKLGIPYFRPLSTPI